MHASTNHLPYVYQRGSNDARWTLADEARQPEDLLSRPVRGGDPRPRVLAAGADQHFDSPLALRALLSGRITHEPIRTERAGLDPVRRYPRLNQRVTNGRDPALAQRQIVLIGALRIRVAGEPEPHGRVLAHVGRDFGGLSRLRIADVRPVIVEHELLHQRPASPRLRGRRRRSLGPCDSCRALYARYSSRALHAGHPGRALHAGHSGGALRPRHPRHPGRTCWTRWTRARHRHQNG